MTIKDCGFIVRKIRITTLDPLRCVICNKPDYSGLGKLWDKGAGEYEYICQDCERDTLADALTVGELLGLSTCIKCGRYIEPHEYAHIVKDNWVCDSCFWELMEKITKEEEGKK